MISHAQIYVTRRCNLSCPRCAAKDRISEVDDWKGDLPWDRFLAIVERLKGLNLETVGFSGGEPTLWPYLIAAIEYLHDHNICKRVRVYSNAIFRTHWDYGSADEVWVSHYGFQNRNDILKLEEHYGKRLVVGWGSHLAPAECPDSPLPDHCGCLMYIFCGESVYPCGWAALRGWRQYVVSLGSDFVTQFSQCNPLYQDICRRCPYNHKRERTATVEVVAGRWRLFRLPKWLRRK